MEYLWRLTRVPIGEEIKKHFDPDPASVVAYRLDLFQSSPVAIKPWQVGIFSFMIKGMTLLGCQLTLDTELTIEKFYEALRMTSERMPSELSEDLRNLLLSTQPKALLALKSESMRLAKFDFLSEEKRGRIEEEGKIRDLAHGLLELDRRMMDKAEF